ncbi:MAG: hypothetical protein CBC28_03365 [Flavobacteriaceae bacterium TMED68]|nr:MAG: hypothetical protein CBC28_03365 [Flavobacteriaceae bacterium TMED68]
MTLARVTLFLTFINFVQAQLPHLDPITVEDYFVIEGDSVMRSEIELKEVIVFQPLNFSSYDEAKRYILLRQRTFRVYQYAKLAADRLNILTDRLNKIKSKRKKRKYLRLIEDFIYNEFELELKKLSRSQGKILIKLIHRQTGNTTHELVKELRNGWRALIYQTTASLFKLSLKETYNPKEIYEDYLIEDILQRAFSNERLERQDTALDYDLDALYIYWKKNKPKPRDKKPS